MPIAIEGLDRVAAILKPTSKMLLWINTYATDIDKDEPLTLDDVRTDCTIVLLPAFQDEEEAEIYLEAIYGSLFAAELASWNEDESVWPEDRSMEFFLTWFDIEFHSLIYDTAESLDNLYKTDRQPIVLQ